MAGSSEIYMDMDKPEIQVKKMVLTGDADIGRITNFKDQQIVTPFFTVKTENSGRRITIEIHGDIRSSLHNVLVTEYCRKLNLRSLRFNADDVPFPVDTELRLSVKSGAGSKRRFDIVYVDEKNEKVGVEIKTKGDVGPNHTAEQLKAYGKAVADKHLDRVIFVVPAEEESNARQILQLLNLESVISIETY